MNVSEADQVSIVKCQQSPIAVIAEECLEGDSQGTPVTAKSAADESKISGIVAENIIQQEISLQVPRLAAFDFCTFAPPKFGARQDDLDHPDESREIMTFLGKIKLPPVSATFDFCAVVPPKFGARQDDLNRPAVPIEMKSFIGKIELPANDRLPDNSYVHLPPIDTRFKKEYDPFYPKLKPMFGAVPLFVAAPIRLRPIAAAEAKYQIAKIQFK